VFGRKDVRPQAAGGRAAVAYGVVADHERGARVGADAALLSRLIWQAAAAPTRHSHRPVWCPRDGLAIPIGQCGLADPQILRNVDDGPAGLGDDPYGPLVELRIELPSLLCHDFQLPLIGLRETCANFEPIAIRNQPVGQLSSTARVVGSLG
jgi:hypothetical protein